jgi:hypothetical protein
MDIHTPEFILSHYNQEDCELSLAFIRNANNADAFSKPL